MSRARVEGDALVFEDPVRRKQIKVSKDPDGDVLFLGDDGVMWMRASDAASVGDWLRRTFGDRDWRQGVDPQHTSIPVQEPTP